MGRPRGFDLADAETTLLDVFWAHGCEGTAVRELCAATGQRQASLYAAFGDKDRMFQVAMGRYLVWIGRRKIPGIEPGRNILVRGRIGDRDGAKVIYNPYYELRGNS